MTLVDIHGRLANTALFYTIILAIWGLWRFFRRQGVAGNYWGALVIAEVLYAVQAGLGAFLFFSGTGNLVGRYIHILYGVVSLIVIPAIFFFTHGNEHRRAMLIYGVGLLFLMGIILRAIATAG
jgi:hypothetical protein